MSNLLVLQAAYERITGDVASAEADVTAALDEAQALLEDQLGRELASKVRLERMYPDTSGRVYPHVTPVTVPPPGLLIDGDTLYSIGPFPQVPSFIFEGNWADLTYTGGYVERSANPTASNRLPEHVERDLCWCAFRILRPAQFAALAGMPAGASRVVLGDAQVAFGNKGQPGEVRIGSDGVTDPVWSKATLRLRRRGGMRAGRL